MVKKSIMIFFFACLSVLLTGCWDRVEIEQRGFVVGTAIDIADEQGGQVENNLSEGKQRLTLTNQFVVPAGLGGKGSGSGGGGQVKPFFNHSTEGYTMFAVIREMAAQTSRSPFYEHLRVIIISEDAAKEGELCNIMDFFIRDHEMRRGMKVFISNGEARSVFNVQLDSEKYPVDDIESISENQRKTARMLPPKRIGDLHQQLLTNRSFAMPIISNTNNNIKITGAAVVNGKDHTMVGQLGEEETKGLNFITGEVKGGVLKANVNENLVSYEVKRARHNIKADVSDKENIEFTMTVDMEGNIVESLERLNYQNPSTITNIEDQLEQEVKRLTNKTIKKVHEDYGVDVLKLGEHLRQEHFKTWEEVKGDWDTGDNYFAKSTINVKADVILRTSGVVNRTEKNNQR